MDTLNEQDIEEIADVIYNLHQLDFRNYAKSSFSRRLTRIMSINVLKSKDELINYIKNITDVNAFLEEITVNTTEMFRDPSFWVSLREKVFPELSTHENIRIWHAGCSSGEEVISMQILLDEMNLRHKVTAYASDIDLTILNRAQTGVYSLKNLSLNENNYKLAGGKSSLKNYYSELDSLSYQFNTELLSNVTFRRFDLVKDTMYTKFDLILCRNVLIYFDFNLQEMVIDKFTTNLFSGGFIAIGQKETLLSPVNLAKIYLYDSPERIYKLLS